MEFPYIQMRIKSTQLPPIEQFVRLSSLNFHCFDKGNFLRSSPIRLGIHVVPFQLGKDSKLLRLITVLNMEKVNKCRKTIGPIKYFLREDISCWDVSGSMDDVLDISGL